MAAPESTTTVPQPDGTPVGLPRLTRDSLESALLCTTKAYLMIHGHRGLSDDDSLMAEARAEWRRGAVEKLAGRSPQDEVLQGLCATDPVLRRGAAILLDVTIEEDSISVRLDGLRRVDEPSRLGDFHYAPVVFSEREKVGKPQRRLLEACGLLIGAIQGRQPDHGLVIHGKGHATSKNRFKPAGPSVRRTLEEARGLARAATPPRLVLNDHCPVCEFRERCRAEALKEDNLSLLRGIGEKELKAYARKGIFTITQLSHTFRPRRKGKRADRRTGRRQHALSALAIRDRAIYVLGTPPPVLGAVNVFLDQEGKPDEGFVYLIGMVVVRGGEERRVSFWADDRGEEAAIFERFLDEIEPLAEFVVFSYGGYEKAFLQRMRRTTERVDLVDRVLKSLVNTLSLVYAHAYFPCFSNGLKEVAGCLGFRWASEGASGAQSLAWRMRWEMTRGDGWKQRLVTYNLDDCLALRVVTEFVHAVGVWAGSGGEKPVPGADGPGLALVHEIDRLANDRKWGDTPYVHPEFDFINDCADFDYQRQRVFVRTSRTLRKRCKKRSGIQRNRKLRKSRDYVIVATHCPSCGSGDVVIPDSGQPGAPRRRRKRAFDLLVTPGGLRRRVVECRSPAHLCRRCQRHFIPDAYEDLDKHFHGLKSWAIYLHVAHQLSCATIAEMIGEFFNVGVADCEVLMFKTLMARRYEPTCRRLLERILAGPVVHVDETEVRLRTGKGYVWVFASLEEAVFMYRPNREGDFVKELLADFRGVLVSDFYAAYDALDCPQQKCLVHLMRDLNQLLLSNPFDQELRSITQPFGTLLRAIVETVDEHGLRRRFLERHDHEVSRFFDSLAGREFGSDAAGSVRDRLVKYRDRLFSFIHHDGVPWNNNCVENAIKRFAYYREGTVGMLTEAGLEDYLVLLSLFQSCRYRGISFFRFLLSRELDLEAFGEGRRSRRPAPPVEVYPSGFVPPHLAGRDRPRDAARGRDPEGDRPPS